MTTTHSGAAPHTADCLLVSDWDHPYSREVAAYPFGKSFSPRCGRRCAASTAPTATGTWSGPARRSRPSRRLSNPSGILVRLFVAFLAVDPRPRRGVDAFIEPSDQRCHTPYGDAPIADRNDAQPWATAGAPPQRRCSVAASATRFTAIGDPAEGLHRDLVHPQPDVADTMPRTRRCAPPLPHADWPTPAPPHVL